MPTALITGLNGFTGQYMAGKLLEEGYAVHGVVRDVDEVTALGECQVHGCDIIDEECLTRVVAKVRPDYVVHLAAVAFVAHGNVKEMYLSNVLGTRALLQACFRGQLTPPKVLIASSANVYGNARGEVLGEVTSFDPVNDYGITKVSTEYLARTMEGKLPFVIARPFNYTGVGQSLSFLIPKIVDHACRRADRIELGNLDVARDFSDVRTIVDAYERMLREPATTGEVYNVCSNRAMTLREVLNLCQDIAGHSMDVVVNPAFVRANEVRTLVGTAQKLEKTIGPLARLPMEQTLRWMIDQGCA